MRRRRWSSTAAAIGLAVVLLAGCSDGGDDSESANETDDTTAETIDLSNIADSPFCESFADVIRSLEEIANNTDPANDVDLLVGFQLAYREVAVAAPEEVREDADTVYQAVDAYQGIADILVPVPDVDEASDRVNSFAEEECGLSMDDIASEFGGL